MRARHPRRSGRRGSEDLLHRGTIRALHLTPIRPALRRVPWDGITPPADHIGRYDGPPLGALDEPRANFGIPRATGGRTHAHVDAHGVPLRVLEAQEAQPPRRRWSRLGS